MARGTVKKLVAERGFGFINAGEEKDLFFHRNDLQGVAYESLMEGQEVEFEVEPTEPGLKAKNVGVAGGSS
jgi:CspA family cold shock protein